MYVACQTDDELAYILNSAGEESLVIGTDYGHSDVSSEIEAFRRVRQRPDVSSLVTDKILSENAKDCMASEIV